jgi:hypothetical protein
MRNERVVLSRRDFIGKALGVTIAMPSIGAVITSCSGGGGSGADGDCSNGAEVRQVEGHPHLEVDLGAAVIAAGEPGLYPLLAGSNHEHDFELTAADFEDLRAGGTLRIRSEEHPSDGHTHEIEIGC